MNDNYFLIYKATNSVLGRGVRLILVSVSVFLLYTRFQNNLDLKSALAILALALINELFIESLSKIRPKSSAAENKENVRSSIIFSARLKIEQKEVPKIIENLNTPAVRFFKNEIGLAKIDNTKVEMSELLKQSQELVVWVGGKYITEVDLLAAYVILSEDETGFLQNNSLNNDDVINILYWARRKFAPDEFFVPPTVLIGPGIFDSLVFGWNYELKKYAKDLTWEVLSRHNPPSVIGREKEYQALEIGLSKHKASNAIIVGEPGVGKTSLVEYLAYACFIGKAPQALFHKKIYELFADRLIAGVSTSGELELRLSTLLSEIAHSSNSLVFIPNIENIFGGGGLGFDISGVLAEYLKSDRIKIVGTTTRAGFADFIQGKQSAADLFEKVAVEEAPKGASLLLLTDKAQEVASRYGVGIKYQALKQAVLLAPVYFPDRFLPGSSLVLLEDVVSAAEIGKKKIIDGKDVAALVQSKTNVALAEPGASEKDLLLHLEEKLHDRIVGQEEAVTAVADAMRRVRAGFKEGNKPIGVFLFLGPTGVGKTETAKALAREYFGSENKMIRLDMSEYQTQSQMGRLLGAKPGEEYVPNALTELVTQNPFSLVLLDEFEKAHPQILDLFLQVFDEGRLTDNQGKTVSFKNTIIIATSNAGAELVREREESSIAISKDELVDYLLKNNLFKPELVNRFDEVIMFRFLNREEVKKIAGILLAESFKKLSENQIKVSVDDKVLDKIAQEAYKPEFGARQIRRYIENNVEEFLSKKILGNEIKHGDKASLSIDSMGNFIVT